MHVALDSDRLNRQQYTTWTRPLCTERGMAVWVAAAHPTYKFVSSSPYPVVDDSTAAGLNLNIRLVWSINQFINQSNSIYSDDRLRLHARSSLVTRLNRQQYTTWTRPLCTERGMAVWVASAHPTYRGGHLKLYDFKPIQLKIRSIKKIKIFTI